MTPTISEKQIRTYIRGEIPRWVRAGSRSFLVEELEVCSGRARIDLALISDQLIGIEIKGPKDDVSRLPTQAKAYSQCFDRVILATHPHLASKAIGMIPEWWGVVVGEEHSNRLRYRFMRRPGTNPALNLDTQLALLWRYEIDALYAALAGCSVKPRANKKAMRAELISRVDYSQLKAATLQKLRDRSEWRWTAI